MRAKGLHHTIVLGTSEPQDFGLLNDGEALVATGFDVALAIRAVAPATLPGTVPTVAWLSQVAGTVRVSGVDQLALGTYKVRFQLTAGGQVGFVPNDAEADTWTVARV